ncbi:PIN domain-containing protein [Pseudarthrobacter sp. H2]|uniref:PIN domain-containing protein n=1 Tax=Pseudarthrobacter sp. H2 TaxID=3418415 RepID=UPI003CE9E731
MAFAALLDTCTLLPISLADLLLRLAEAKTYRALWSEEILLELERNLVKKAGVKEVPARRRVDAMREHFPDAMVENFEDLVPSMSCDPKDRHVLAAAVRANAAVIVTYNLKDFPVSSTRPYDISVVSPDDFLLDQFDLYPQATAHCVVEQAGAYQNPQLLALDLVGHFERVGLPLFADRIRPAVAAFVESAMVRTQGDPRRLMESIRQLEGRE